MLIVRNVIEPQTAAKLANSKRKMAERKRREAMQNRATTRTVKAALSAMKTARLRHGRNIFG